jgi:ATP-binding cassette subfamily B protein
VTVIAVFAVTALFGALSFIGVWVNARVFDTGLAVASGTGQWARLIPYLAAFIVIAIIPTLLDGFIWSYAEPRCQLVLRTAYRGKMLQKLKRLKYEHLENDQSMEIIEKAFNRVENAARHLFPMYVHICISSIVASAGLLWLFISVKWWFALTILVPFVIETILASRVNMNIYEEMEGYYQQERKYTMLGGMLNKREYIRENRVNGSADRLIGEYKSRLNKRNREYEKFYFKNMKRKFTTDNVTKIAQIGNALLLLWLFTQGALGIGMLISLTLAVFSTLFSKWGGLFGIMHIPRWGGMHAKSYEFYDKFFDLSEAERGDDDSVPADVSIEFDDVHFKYPGTDKPILQGLSFTIKPGEKVSIVGENGEGKTTMAKLLLGLFEPDSGEIRVGGKPLREYSQAARQRLFGAVFQDFVKFSFTLAENVGVGDVDKINDADTIAAAMNKAKVTDFANELADMEQTLLGRDFDGGVDISGGQWQRIAIARAFMGDKPIMILDEPTSQLDPMAESQLYGEFSEMSSGKTAIFITHRLGSTSITDRILVISGGRVTESGTREELLSSGGLYADMWNAQKQWYQDKEAEE